MSYYRERRQRGCLRLFILIKLVDDIPVAVRSSSRRRQSGYFVHNTTAWRKKEIQIMAAEKSTKEKPLEKMTSKELREIALEIPDVTGVHGMNKAELVSIIRKARGIEEPVSKKGDTDIRVIKSKISELKKQRQEAADANDSKKAAQLRRRISRLKKKTRRAA